MNYKEITKILFEIRDLARDNKNEIAHIKEQTFKNISIIKLQEIRVMKLENRQFLFIGAIIAFEFAINFFYK